MLAEGTNKNTSLKYYSGTMSDSTKTRNGERKNEKWEQGRVLQMKSLIGLGFNLSFALIFLFPVPYHFKTY